MSAHPVLVAKKPKIQTLTEHVQKIHDGTWASIAAIPTGKENKLIKHHPEDGLKRSITEEENRVFGPDHRVLWIRCMSGKKPALAVITKGITEGAVYSIGYSEADGAMCVIFKDAAAAQRCFDTNRAIVESSDSTLFGKGFSVIMGAPFPFGNELAVMDFPKNERRRLTFVRSRFFTEGFSEKHFKKDLHDLVGEENVELVWVFNTGNGKLRQASISSFFSL